MKITVVVINLCFNLTKYFPISNCCLNFGLLSVLGYVNRQRLKDKECENYFKPETNELILCKFSNYKVLLWLL